MSPTVHAVRPIAQRVGAGVVGADEVAQDRRPGRGGPLDRDARLAFAEITLPAPCAVPPIVVPGEPVDVDAGACVAQGRVPV